MATIITPFTYGGGKRKQKLEHRIQNHMDRKTDNGNNYYYPVNLWWGEKETKIRA